MKADSIGRRSAQYTINEIVNILIKSISPILPFTAYEFKESLKPGCGDEVFYAEFAKNVEPASQEDIDRFDFLISLRSRVYQAIETERQKGNIKNALDCDLQITLPKNDFESISIFKDEICKFFISSSCKVEEGDTEVIVVKKSENEKCSRCWHRSEELDQEKICKRCELNINGDGELRSFF